MKKRLLVLLAVMSLIIGLVGGCTKNDEQTDASSTDNTDGQTQDNQEETEKIVLSLTWWGNQARNDLTQKAIALYMENNPHIEIKPEFTDWSGYWDKLSTMASGGNLPDIIQQDYAYINQYQRSNQLANLSEFIDSGVIDISKIPESVIQSGSIDGNCYGISLGSNAPMMVYDKAIVEEAGVEMPMQPTLDEIYEIGQIIYEKTGVQTYFDGGLNMLQTVARGNESNAFEELEAGVIEATLEHFNNVERFKNAEFSISPELLVEKNPDIVETKPLVDQTTWNDFAFSNQFLSIAQVSGRELGICMYPLTSATEKQTIYLKPSQFFSIAETSEHKKEAAEFLNWFVNSHEANAILMGERGIPINTEIQDAMKANVDDTSAMVFDYIAEVGKIAEPIDAPNPTGAGQVEAELKTSVENIRYGDGTPDNIADNFVQSAKTILEEASK